MLAGVALAVAACGGGGGSTTSMPTEPTEPPAPPPPANLTTLFAAAQDASNDAMMAGEDATAAEMSATEFAMKLSTTVVAGDSMTAMMNAQAVLDARDDAAQAVMDAETALAAARKARMDALAIPDDHPQKATLTTAIDAAIRVAEAQVKATTAVRDGMTIENAVRAVTGADGTGTARSIADMVGMHIAEALAPGTSRGGTRIAHGVDAPAETIEAGHKYVTDDHQGMTWLEIVGEDNVMMERIGASNAAVPVKSISGMAVSAVFATIGSPGATLTSADTISDATEYDFSTNGSNYKGIPGAIWCLGDDCMVDASGMLAGSWYFTPTWTTAYYQSRTDDTTTPNVDESMLYEAETLYASYGHWLTTDGADWTVNTFASLGVGGTTNAADVTTVGDTTNMLANMATYSGSAAGMSVLKMGSGDSQITDSGRFTADVTLTANFGATPTVSGTINNFQGDAVDSGWSVNLMESTLDTSSNDGIATGGGREGIWSATAYGTDATARPAGIFGGFTAHFADGHAAGAFAAR